MIRAALVISIALLCAAAPHPASAHDGAPSHTDQVRATITAFIHAYNRHDLKATVRTLGAYVRWGDCDYRAHTVYYSDTRKAAVRWIRARFADHDLLGDATVEYVGETSAAIGVTRTSDSRDPLVQAGKLPARQGYKVFLNGSGTRISFMVMGGMPFCGVGALPPGAEPDRERAMADRFLHAYDSGDLASVVSLLSPNVVYIDGDPMEGMSVLFTSASPAKGFLADRFSAGDRFTACRYILDGVWSQPDNSPLTIVVDATRSAGARGPAPHPVQIVLTLNKTADTLDQVLVYELSSGCPVGP